jgi:excisionase family DNA binding protein
MTLNEAAARLGLSLRTVQRQVAKGTLETRMIEEPHRQPRHDVTIGMLMDFERAYSWPTNLAHYASRGAA